MSTNDADDKKKVWIGLAHLIPNKDNNELGEAKGAYVNILAYAENQDHYIKLVKFAAYEHKYCKQRKGFYNFFGL